VRSRGRLAEFARADELASRITDLEAAMPALKALYSRADLGYEAHMREHGLSCGSCFEAPCCRVDLRLHTYLEKYYLLQGFGSLEAGVRDGVVALCVRGASAEGENEFCVMRGPGVCLIYPWRPLICRLAGPAHSFQGPRGGSVRGDGCPQLLRDPGRDTPPRMDRTPYYRDMSLLELNLVNEFGARSTAVTIAGTVLATYGPH
jgi:hypothetical protein